jgi:hypothetical protein
MTNDIDDTTVDESDDDEGEDLIACDVCGDEEDEDVVTAHWASFIKGDVLEVVVCDDCCDSPEKMTKAFEMFQKGLEELRLAADED